MGILVFDWFIFRAVWNWLQRQGTELWKIIPVLTVFAGIVTVTGIFMRWIDEHGLLWLVAILTIGFLLIGTLPWFRAILYNTTCHFRDTQTYKSILFGQTMTRNEIASNLRTLTTRKWRLVFVNRLDQNNTVATGDWPSGFELKVSDDLAITELARLEERWLKLDR
ncbi:MAG: hypothetical protein QM706_09520 [Nitrospira sp.]